MKPPVSIAGVLDASLVRGAGADPAQPPDLLIEVPHGATRTADFTSLTARLKSRLPAELIDFFHVNTDSGAFELGQAVARLFAQAEPSRSVLLLRCLLPRTFIDCNRRIDASPEEFKAGKVTPGLMPWITDAGDQALLRGLYQQYVGAVRQASRALGDKGAMLLLHSYAPREVGVEVDLQIVESLHRAYQPEVERTWPLRPEIDVIGRGVDGVSLAPETVRAALGAGFGEIGLTVADSLTYPLHPSTLAWEHVAAHPGRALCIEFRRDLLADPFQPFVEMKIGEEKVHRLAGPLTQALQKWW